jgi:hypothetical protein
MLNKIVLVGFNKIYEVDGMKIAILPSKSAPRGREMLLRCLLFCFALCLLTTLPAAAQAESLTPFSADLDGYATLGFYVPSGATVEPESLAEANYTEGREVNAVLLINGSRVSLHLLYPCQAPASQLEPDALKAAINAFNSGLNQTIYNPTPLNISGQSALWGQVGNQIVIAYQPSIQTIALVLIDESLDENTLEYLIGSLQITVNQGSSPLWPGYCPDTTEPEVAAAEPAGSANEDIALASKMLEDKGPEVEVEPTVPESGKGRMSADIEAAKEKLEAAKRKF